MRMSPCAHCVLTSDSCFLVTDVREDAIGIRQQLTSIFLVSVQKLKNCIDLHFFRSFPKMTFGVPSEQKLHQPYIRLYQIVAKIGSCLVSH